MSVRVGLTIAVLVILAVVIAGFIVITIRTNDAMPNIAKTAEAITNATLVATLRGGS